MTKLLLLFFLIVPIPAACFEVQETTTKRVEITVTLTPELEASIPIPTLDVEDISTPTPIARVETTPCVSPPNMMGINEESKVLSFGDPGSSVVRRVITVTNPISGIPYLTYDTGNKEEAFESFLLPLVLEDGYVPLISYNCGRFWVNPDYLILPREVRVNNN